MNLKSAFTAGMLLWGMSAFAQTLFGYAPVNPPTDNLTAQGSGKNCFVEGAITLDPAANPVAAALKGAKITGVKCYMRSDYMQKSKRYSSVNVRVGDISSTPVKHYADFKAGWNEVMLDEPVEIGDEAIHIGPMVYETSGNPYPLVSAPGAALPGAYSISLARQEWQHLSERGNLLCHLIIDADPASVPVSAQAAVTSLPQVVAPGKKFSSLLTIHNFSATPIETAEITNVTDNGAASFTTTLTFTPALAAFDSRTLTVQLQAGNIEDPAMGHTLTVSAINGHAAEVAPESTFAVHVTDNAFVRVPLIEEFTSRQCVNCPYMAYYLDQAMEQFEGPHVYITRHTGFAKDNFTHPFDEELLYLFGPVSNQANPAVMYDRTIRSESDICPVYKAYTASITPYSEAIAEMAAKPAMVKVLVYSSVVDGKVSCTVEGKVAEGISTDGLYLNASFIENGISAEKYKQEGVYNPIDGSPADLAERFRHNGIVRVAFNSGALGDPLEVDPETREFKVNFGSSAIDPEWNLANCEAVAFVCKVNKENLRENYVLNAGGTRWNLAVDGNASIQAPEATPAAVKVYVGSDGRVNVEGNYLSAGVYTLGGSRLATGAVLAPGVYIVAVTTPAGVETFKVVR